MGGIVQESVTRGAVGVAVVAMGVQVDGKVVGVVLVNVVVAVVAVVGVAEASFVVASGVVGVGLVREVEGRYPLANGAFVRTSLGAASYQGMVRVAFPNIYINKYHRNQSPPTTIRYLRL